MNPFWGLDERLNQPQRVYNYTKRPNSRFIGADCPHRLSSVSLPSPPYTGILSSTLLSTSGSASRIPGPLYRGPCSRCINPDLTWSGSPRGALCKAHTGLHPLSTIYCRKYHLHVGALRSEECRRCVRPPLRSLTSFHTSFHTRMAGDRRDIECFTTTEGSQL